MNEKRKVVVYEWQRVEGKMHSENVQVGTGVFHRFGVNYQEFESGPGHRPIDLSCARDLRDQCRNSGIPFFFKKVGGMNSLSMAKTPADLQIQESPIWLS